MRFLAKPLCQTILPLSSGAGRKSLQSARTSQEIAKKAEAENYLPRERSSGKKQGNHPPTTTTTTTATTKIGINSSIEHVRRMNSEMRRVGLLANRTDARLELARIRNNLLSLFSGMMISLEPFDHRRNPHQFTQNH